MVTFWEILWTLRQHDPPLFSEYTQQNQLLQWHTGAMVFHPVRVGTLHSGHIGAKIQSHECVTCNINKYTYGSQEALVGKQKKSSLNTSEPQHLAGISSVSVPLIQTELFGPFPVLQPRLVLNYIWKAGICPLPWHSWHIAAPNFASLLKPDAGTESCGMIWSRMYSLLF